MPARHDLHAPLRATPLDDGMADGLPAVTAQVVGVVHGALTLEAPDCVWVVPAGHTAWVPAHRLTRTTRHGAVRGWCVQMGDAASSDLPGGICVAPTSGLLHEAALRACTWPDGPREPAHWRIAGVVLDELAALGPRPALGLPLPAAPDLRTVAQAMREDLASEPGLPHWAARADMPPRTLTRRFADETGLSIGDWRQRARVLRAIEGLAEGRAPGDIAPGLGYDNARSFSAMFRRELGTLPTRFLTAAG